MSNTDFPGLDDRTTAEMMYDRDHAIKDKMWMVASWSKTKFFGPFLERKDAVAWLRKQGIHAADYNARDISITEIADPSDKIE